MKGQNIFAGALVFCFLVFPIGCAEKTEDVTRNDRYEHLVSLFHEFRDFQKPEVIDGVPQYTAAAMEKQKRGLGEFRDRLAAIDFNAWPISQQVDYHIVRAEMNGLDFDHRILRPWSRNPHFYAIIFPSPTDVPAREGSVMCGAIELWKYSFPLSDEDGAELKMRLRAIPEILNQAKVNLVEEAKDLWFLGIWKKNEESVVFANLVSRLAEQHPDLVPEAEQAKVAVDDFRDWLKKRHSKMSPSPSGIGIENFNWYMKNVHLNPYTWQDQVVIVQRELERALSQLKLEENRNRNLPRLEPVVDEHENRRLFTEGVDEFIEFLQKEEIFTVPKYMHDALFKGGSRFVASGAPRGLLPPSDLIDFFAQVNARDKLPMRCHGTHWFDLARMEQEPHPSPIRRVPLLYNIWDSRAEGLATGMEEMMMHAGLLDKRPRARELVYILLANRAARAMGDLKMHSHEFTVEEAVKNSVEWTPYGWFLEEGRTVWFDAALYMTQPGYGASYVVGKVHLDKLLAESSHKLGENFNLRNWWDEFHAAGMIPVSLIRWEMTGLVDEVKKLW